MNRSVPTTPPSARRLEIEALVRVDEPERAAAAAVRALAQTVADWDAGTELAITLVGGRRRRRLSVSLEQRGSVQPEWEADVRWCLRDVARVRRVPAGRPAAVVPAGTTLSELVGSRAQLAQSLPTTPRWSPAEEYDDAVLRMRQQAPWPQPLVDTLADLAALLVGQDGLVLRMRLAPATPMEIAMVGQRLADSWTGGASERAAYLGRPLRVRTLLGATGGPLPSRFRALARRLGTSLDLVDIAPEDVAAAWAGGAASLAMHAVPEAVALALVRLPVAGDRAVPGMATVHAPVPVRALDPVPPRPAAPIRIGTAVSATGARVDVTLDARDLPRHGLIEGTTGAGKSTIVAALIRELTCAGFGCTFLDPHGTTIDQVLAELPAGSERVSVVRHGDEAGVVPINVLNGTTAAVEREIEAFAELVQQMYDPDQEGIVGPRWRRWFSLVALGVHHALGEQASLAAVTEVGSDVERVKRLASALQADHPQLAKSLVDEIVNDRSSEAASLLAWCISKLQPLVSTGTTRAILGTGADAVDVAAAMDAGRTLLIDLASPTLGQPQARMLGALWLRKHQRAMGARTAPERPHLVIVDEASLMQFGPLPAMLSEGRKFGVGVLVVVQYVGQLRQDLAESVETNAGTFLTLRTGLSYAPRSSVRLGGWPVGELVRLPNLTAAATISREGTMSEPFTLHVDHHERMVRSGARGPEAAARAAEVVARSHRELVAPHVDRPVLDAGELDRLLRARPSRPTHADEDERPGLTGEPGPWSVKLVEADVEGSERMRLIRAIRSLTALSLTAAVGVVDHPPAYVVRGVSRPVADTMVQRLRPLGAVLTLEDGGPPDPPATRSSFLDDWLARRQGSAADVTVEVAGGDDDAAR